MLNRWFSGLETPAFLGGLGLLLGLFALWVFKPWQRESDSQLRLFNAFERLLARHGLRRLPGEGAEEFSRRAAQLLPGHAEAIAAFTREFQAQRYAGHVSSPAELRRRLKQLRRRLPWRLSAVKDIHDSR